MNIIGDIIVWPTGDNTAYYAVYSDFNNLQESPCGIGSSMLDAIKELRTQELRICL